MKAMIGAATLAALLSLPGVASAAPQTATAEFGSVRAELKWDDQRPSQTAPALRITRSGGGFDYAPAECSAGTREDEGLHCEQPRVFEDHEFFVLRDIDADGEPEVIIDLFTGGAHCCSILSLYRWDEAAQAYSSFKYNFGDPGFVLRDVENDGKVEFHSADPRFAFAFTSFAESRFPIQIFEFTAGDLEDVTLRYPALIREDAAEHRKAFREMRAEGADGKGALAAFLADKYRLGEAAQGRRQVRRALKRGGLKRAERRFLRKMPRRLKRWGYAGSAASSTG